MAMIHDFRHTPGRQHGRYNGDMTQERWLNAAAYGTWFVVGLPTLAEIRAGEMRGFSALIWTAAFVTFPVAFAAFDRCTAAVSRSTPRALLAVQALAGLTMVYVSGNATIAATLVIVAAEAAAFFSPLRAWLWVGAQSAGIAAIWWRYDGWIGALSVGGAFAGFQAFALATMSLARREHQARETLARTNAELTATQALLSENSRVAERLRISRDLHDALGHHLTALSLQLDVASRLAEGQAAQHVHEAHAITRLLLSDVRDVVSEMREGNRIDLAGALRRLADVPGDLAVHLEVPQAVGLDDPAQAHALFRSVQEIITNTARHARARNLWIRLEPQPDGIALHARDDGRGADALTFGNGLRGMRERFEEYAGRVDVASSAGEGFEIHAFMPRPQPAS